MGSAFVLIVHLLFSEVAFAERNVTQEGIQLRSWTEETPVNVWIKDPILLIAFTDSVSRIFGTDEEFSNLQNIKVLAIQEGDSADEIFMRMTAKDKRWLSAGTITFDANIRVYEDKNIGALTVTAWSSSSGGYNTNGPRYDLPRAIILPK